MRKIAVIIGLSVAILAGCADSEFDVAGTSESDTGSPSTVQPPLDTGSPVSETSSSLETGAVDSGTVADSAIAEDTAPVIVDTGADSGSAPDTLVVTEDTSPVPDTMVAPDTTPSEDTTPVVVDSGSPDTFVAPDTYVPPEDTAPVLCGNGTIDPGEECDDGNSLKCDGCESCQLRKWAKSGWAVVDPAPIIPISGEGCYEIWAKPDVGSEPILLAAHQATIYNFYIAYFPNLTFRYGKGAVTHPVAPDGKWHHYAACKQLLGGATKFPSRLTLFYDGVLVGQTDVADVSTTINATKMFVGGIGSADFPGNFDEVRVSNTVIYTANFTPERRLSGGFTVHFDKPQAGVLVSSTFQTDTGYTPAACL